MRHDVCPDCGGQRDELVCAPSRFYGPACRSAGIGPSEQPAPAGAQLDFALNAGAEYSSDA